MNDKYNYLKDNWQDILLKVKNENNIKDVSFNTWIKPLGFYDYNEADSTVTIVVNPNRLGEVMDFGFIINRYSGMITDVIMNEINEEIVLNFMSKAQLEEMEKRENLKNNVKGRPSGEDNDTFDNFIVGENNDLAQAAALAVAESPGETRFNPLFIYGGSGLGKTHLMHAIANFINENHPNLKVLFVNSETFTNELVYSFQEKNTELFREKYRNNDVLLIDDIQFIIGKERTQEEFFHTFNEMRDSGRQIVISSDKHPKDMKILDERMKSRIEWGLTVDIQPPSYEVRLAILNEKLQKFNVSVPANVLEYVATNIKSNVRELESALTRIIFMAQLKRVDVTLDLAIDALKEKVNPDEKKVITPEFIVSVVADHYELTAAQLKGGERSKKIAYPRQIAMYLSRELAQASLKDIGDALGGRDHSTVLHGCNKIEEDLKEDTKLKNVIEILTRKINPDE